MSIWKSKTVILYSLVIGLVFLILGFLKLPDDSYLWREFSNFGHTPLFGLIALALLGLLSKLLPPGFPRFFQYFLAAAGASLMGLAYELIQIPTPGDSDPTDLIRNSAGILGFLSIRLATDRGYWLNRNEKSPKKRLRWLATGLIVLLIASLPLIVWAVAYWERDNSFPQLTNFNSTTGRLFIKTYHSNFETVEPPANWSGAPAERVGQLTCYPGYEQPGLRIDDPIPDWENYSYLYLELFSSADSAQSLMISIEDDKHNRKIEDRFSSRLTLSPGLNRVELSLDSIRVTPSGRLLELNSIARINLSVNSPKASVSFYLSNIELR